MIYAILATGQSMTLEVAQSVMGKCKVIAVSDAWRLAPWSDYLVSSDAAWWQDNADALNFPREKFTVARNIEDVERVDGVSPGSNSGLLALHVARNKGATKVLLLGYDMQGTHFFGPHARLKNTNSHRFSVFKKQFQRFRPKDMQIINCTKNSALTCYPMGTVKEHLC